MSDEQNTENQATETPDTEQAATDADAAVSGEQTATGAAAETQAEPETKATEAEDTKDGQQAPEQYEDFAAPEGTELDGETVDTFKDVARELNLTQEQAQSVIDKMTPVMAQRQQAQMAAQAEQWAEDSRNDEEFGGEQFDENIATAKRAMDQFASDELKGLLDDSGLGSHPEVIRMFHKVGSAISEDSVVTGGSGQGQRKSFYPNSNMK